MARYLSGLVRSSSSSSYHAVSPLFNSPFTPILAPFLRSFTFTATTFPVNLLRALNFTRHPFFPFFFSSPRLENVFEVLQGVEGKGLLCGLCKWKERFDVISFFLW